MTHLSQLPRPTPMAGRAGMSHSPVRGSDREQKRVAERAFHRLSGFMLIEDSWPLLHQFVWIRREFLNSGRPEDALDMFWHDRQAQPLKWVEPRLCPLLVEWEYCTFIFFYTGMRYFNCFHQLPSASAFGVGSFLKSQFIDFYSDINFVSHFKKVFRLLLNRLFL